MSCCRLAWHNFQKYVNSDPCKERKPCVKWINDNTFLAISDVVDKRFLDNFAYGRLRTSSEDFGRLRKTSDFFGNLRKWSCRFQKSQCSQDKSLTPTSQKKLAGIQTSFKMLKHSFTPACNTFKTGIWMRRLNQRSKVKSRSEIPYLLKLGCSLPFTAVKRKFSARKDSWEGWIWDNSRVGKVEENLIIALTQI